MIWRIIAFWLASLTFAFADLPRHAGFTFAGDSNTLVNGVNTFTLVAQNLYGVAVTNSLSLNLPTPVPFQYDANGNLISDGTRVFSYDAENQLTNVFVTNGWQVGFVYDGLNRRRIERDYTWSGAWVKTNETRFVYDGSLTIQERDTNNNVLVAYTRGLDVSLTLKQAGGIGGLLARTDENGSTYYHADASGNVTALMDGDENIIARYEYDGFGKQLGQWGSLADVNRYRFSSKDFVSQAGLYYFGRRFYDPNLQRWPNRDPLGERGGINLYAFVRNSPVDADDPLGFGENDPPPTVSGPNPGFPLPNPLLPDPSQLPPGYNPGWPSGVDNRGPYVQDPNTGTKYYPHPEDPRHWPHYDDDKGGRYPDKCEKPRPGQKRPPYGKQSPTNPWQQPPPTPTPPTTTPIIIDPITPIPTAPLPTLPELPVFEPIPIPI